jgi:hypothetical protein
MEKINNMKYKEHATRFDNIYSNGINEQFSTVGVKSMYGMTKYASELLIQEYMAAYDVKAIINRCGVIAGPWQMGKVDQGVVTLWVLHHMLNKPLQYIGYGGKGKQVRDFVHIDDIFDLLGIRMVVRTKEDCYRTLGIVHGHWRPIPGRFKDCISVPKPNGYQSLHTTVLGMGQSRIPIEIQIRTEKMNSDAERGPAAHWAYKKTGKSDFDKEYLTKTAWLPKKLQKHEPLEPEEYFKEVSESIFSERVLLFKRRWLTKETGGLFVELILFTG